MKAGVVALACAVGLVGCSKAEPPLPKPKWTAAPEDSFSLYDQSDSLVAVSRCWHRKEGYHCIGSSGISTFQQLGRFDSPTLPETPAGIPPGAGYACSVSFDSMASGSITERIDGANSTLTSHSAYNGPIATQAPWTREYVEQYMRENNLVHARPYFDCRAVADALQAGSPETLTTTSVRYADVVPESQG